MIQPSLVAHFMFAKVNIPLKPNISSEDFFKVLADFFSDQGYVYKENVKTTLFRDYFITAPPEQCRKWERALECARYPGTYVFKHVDNRLIGVPPHDNTFPTYVACIVNDQPTSTIEDFDLIV